MVVRYKLRGLYSKQFDVRPAMAWGLLKQCIYDTQMTKVNGLLKS
jgi:hypothetical protein